MKDFRVHLHAFESRGRGSSLCSAPKPLSPAHTPGIEIDEMMKAKFKRTWRHSVYAWITFMAILLLAYVYASNTKWDDSWFRTPTKYNITALLEGDMDDDSIINIGPGKPLAEEVEDVPAKKGKTSKKKLIDDGSGNGDEMAAEDADTAPEMDGVEKAAKTPKTAKEDK